MSVIEAKRAIERWSQAIATGKQMNDAPALMLAYHSRLQDARAALVKAEHEAQHSRS
jgi:hypothetical protein